MKPYFDRSVMVRPLTKIEEFLNEVLPYVDSNVPTHINSGGCGVFADILSDNLDRVNIKHKIYASFNLSVPAFFRRGFDNFISTGDEKWLRTAGEDHIVIEVNGVFFDSEGIETGIYDSSSDMIEISKDQLRAFIRGSQWNRVFDRGTIPQIIELMDKVFSSYDQWEAGKFEPLNRIRLNDYTVSMVKRAYRIAYGAIPFNYSMYTPEEEAELRISQNDPKNRTIRRVSPEIY